MTFFLVLVPPQIAILSTKIT